MTIIEGKLNLDSNTKIAIINARFNHIITDRLVEGARDAFLRHGGKEENLSLILVPGAFELPFALKKAIESKNLMRFVVWVRSFVAQLRILIMFRQKPLRALPM